MSRLKVLMLVLACLALLSVPGCATSGGSSAVNTWPASPGGRPSFYYFGSGA